MGKEKKHVENIIDAETIVRELSKMDDVKVRSSTNGKATIFDTGSSEVIVRPSESKGIAVDLKEKDEK